jgi:hypothetical protein
LLHMAVETVKGGRDCPPPPPPLEKTAMPAARSESAPQSKTRMHARTEHREMLCPNRCSIYVPSYYTHTHTHTHTACCRLMHRCCSFLLPRHAVFKAAVNRHTHTRSHTRSHTHTTRTEGRQIDRHTESMHCRQTGSENARLAIKETEQ